MSIPFQKKQPDVSREKLGRGGEGERGREGEGEQKRERETDNDRQKLSLGFVSHFVSATRLVGALCMSESWSGEVCV